MNLQRSLLAFIFLGLTSLLQAQTCSLGSYQLTDSHTDITKSDPGPPIPTVTLTYQFTCYHTSATGTVGDSYYTIQSINSNTGSCGDLSCSPGNTQTCMPFAEAQVTQATSTSDYNRFYNRMWQGLMAGNCIKGNFSQDFKQCAGLGCPVVAGGGTGVGPTNPCLGGSGSDNGGAAGLISGSTSPDPTCSPIIIDTEGEGFQLTSAANGVMFDIRGDGHPVQIAWTAPGSHNAFLALDRNGDGKISSGKELFGNFTAQDAARHKNGFLALAEFDEPDQGGNGDGIIDEHDQVFSRLRLWIDENHDGIAQPSELHTLPELGVFSISLKYEMSPNKDVYGNRFLYKGRVNPGLRRDSRDEHSEVGRWAYDVFLMTKE